MHSGEWFLSDLSVHESYERWRASRKGDFLDEVRERVDRILATHQPLPLDEEVAKELDRIRRCAKRASRRSESYFGIKCSVYNTS